MENDDTKQRKKSRFKSAAIIIAIIILALIIIGTFVYFNNKAFKNNVNTYLEKAPGFIGRHFRNYPTENEGNDKKAYLADYYLSLDTERAADKIYIIKKNDEKLFNDIVKIMNEISPNKTEEILKLVRNNDLRKDWLSSIYDEIEKGKGNQLKDEIKRFEKDDLVLSINEIERRINDNGYEQTITEILSFMNEEKASEILYYLDEGIRNDLMKNFDEQKRNNFENKIMEKGQEENSWKYLAKSYEAKSVEKAKEEIGDDKTYSIRNLAKIYTNLSVKKSAEILSTVDDEEFIDELLSNISKEELLNKKEGSLTSEISEAIKFISEYNSKIDGLVIVYEKMNPDAVAKIVEDMLGRDNKVTALEIKSKPIYEISDSTIIVDVLSRMRKQTLSKIINNMDTKKASELTQKLAKP